MKRTKRKKLFFVIQDDKAIRVQPGDLSPVGKTFRQFASVAIEDGRVVPKVVNADDIHAAAKASGSSLMGAPVGRNGKGVVFQVWEFG